MTPLDDGPSDALPHDPVRDIPSGPEDVLPARPPGRRAKPAPEPTPSPMGRLVLPIILMIVAAVALFAAWTRLDRGTETAAGPAASSSPSASPSASPSTKPTTTPSSSASATPKPSSSSAQPSKTALVIDRSVPVTVLNGTRRTGLASRVAADLRSKGWTVVSVGNWRSGGVSTTTVFVDGRDDAAATMRRDLEAADATKKPIGAMRSNRITIVLMDDYPRS